jgi:type I restriction enzyme S subunit
MNDVPEGYKMSEMGVIPKEWEVYSINQLIEENIIERPLDGNHGDIHPKSKDFVNDGIPFVMANNIDNGILDLKNCNFIKKEQADNLQKGFSVSGDVLLTHKGTVGNTVIVGKISTDYIMLTPQVTYYRVKNENRIKNEYIKYYFDSDTFQSILANLSGGGTRAYIGITNQWKLPFILPPFSEQQAISSTLSDIDALITALEQLITKKRNIKQGAMQQLLTGKKRLPGFRGEWEVKMLENVCAKNGLVRGPFGGTLKKEFFVRNGLKVYEQKNAIYKNVNLGNYFIDKNKFNELKRFEVKKGDFIVSCSGTIGKIYQIPKGVDCGIINQALLKIKTDDNIIHDRFFFYYFDWEKFQEKIIDNTQGGAMQNLVGMNIFRNTQILLPPLPEQQAIAQILSDMDTEIKSLEQKRDKYKVIKQGMMQELLSGKTRLVKEDKT